MSFHYSPKIVTDGLVFYLDAANSRSYPGSGTSWIDLGKNKTNGLLTNGPTFDSSNGGSILFDGLDDYVDWSTNPLSSLSIITYDCWFKASGTGHSFFTISSSNFRVYYQNVGAPAIGWYFAFSGQNIYFNYSYNTNWTNIVYSYDGSTHLCYINGVSYSFIPGSGTSSQSNLRISGRSTASTLNLNGNIASTKIYNRAFTSSEILQNYNATKTRFGL